MEQKELNKILESHKSWLQSEGGECADLHGADLRDADLREADLRDADLREADLRDADLRDADLRGADLRDADLRDADLHWADLRWADLRDADFHGADLRWADFENVIGLSALSVQVNTSCENRKITYIPSLDVVTTGCFQGTFEEFEERVEEEHENNPFVLSLYRRVIAFLKEEAEEDRKREKEMTTAGQGDGQSVQD